MPFLFLFFLAVISTIVHLLITKRRKNIIEVFLSYLILFNIGIMSLLSFYAHVFMSDEVAKNIGWPTGNPFQFEVAVANLAFGILGILAYWFRGLFWLATVLGNSIFLLGAFVGHLIQYFKGDLAPYNIGMFVWIVDLILPILYLILLSYYIREHRSILRE